VREELDLGGIAVDGDEHGIRPTIDCIAALRLALLGIPPSPALEAMPDAARNESTDRSVYVSILKLVLLVPKEPLGNDEVQLLLGSRHGDVEQSALFLDIFRLI
jgi:hypothetical protein